MIQSFATREPDPILTLLRISFSVLHNRSRRSRRCGDCNRREATRPMTSWCPLHPYTYSLDLGGAAAAGVLQEGWRQETGAKGGASRFPLTFCLLRFRGVSGEVSPDPSCKSDVGDVGGEASSGRLLSPDSSSPVRCSRQRCALLPRQKHSGARRMAQDERLGCRGAPRPLIKKRPLQTAPIPPYT